MSEYFASSKFCTCSLYVLFFVFQAICVGSCPVNTYEYNGFCYLIKRVSASFKALNFMDANFFCKTNGGNLISLVDSSEFNNLLKIMAFGSSQSFYIGLNDIDQEGQFVWSDQTVSSFANWNPGEPNGGRSENCVIILSTTNPKFNDVSCSTLCGFICKLKDYCAGNNCSVNAICNDIVGGYNCSCKNGFSANNGGVEQLGNQCQDINECALPMTNNCSSNAICNNFDCGFNCTCKCGFKNNNGGLELYSDKCQVESCSLLLKQSANYYNEEIDIHINMSTDCLCDVQNLTVYLEPESLLTFKKFVWNNSNINDLNVRANGKYLVIHVKTLSKTKYASFSSIFVFGEKIPHGKINMTVNVYQSWIYYSTDLVLRTARKIISVSIEKLLSPVNKMASAYTQPKGASLQTKTHQFICATIKKRQPSRCYQRELTTGIITFLPLQVVDVIGYDSNTTLIYGRTTRNKFIELNLSNRKPYVIKEEKCIKIKACYLGEN